jgi:ketosteroid isomerase-like protein
MRVDKTQSRRTSAILAASGILCLALVPLALGQSTNQAGDPDATKLLALEHSWNQAQLAGDASAMDIFMADRFVDTEWDGKVMRKAQFLADVKDTSSKPTTNVNSDLHVEVYGDTGIVTGAYHATGTYKGKHYEYAGRFTDTWVRKGSGWLCVASQWNRYPEKH